MDRTARLRDRLPSLYRPDPDDEGLLPAYLSAAGAGLDAIDVDALGVLRGHWFDQADAAVLDPYLVRLRELAGQPPMGPSDPEARTFPYLRDLALLSALLGASPWQDAPPVETVEDFRDRVRRTVAVYRGGLGTPAAIRGIVEANLPVDDSLPAERRDRPFELEEFAPIVHESLAVRSPGPPEDMVGPLMRWEVASGGLHGSPPTIYVQGVEPVDGAVGATERPMVELFAAAGRRVRLGIAYAKTLDPGVTLRLRPAFSSWLARDDRLVRADAVPPGGGPADPTASGPWVAVEGAPAGTATAFVQTRDLSLWVGTVDGGSGALSRFDGTAWTQALTGLAEVHALAEDGDDLLIATETGLLRMPRFPDGDPFAGTAVAGLETASVRALLPDGDGWLVGTAAGLARLAADGTVGPFGLDASLQTATPVHALARDGTGTVHAGTDLGAFQFQPATGQWYWYGGGSLSEQDPDWHELLPGGEGPAAALPADADVTLPPVLCVRRGPDAALWFGTDHGIARYVAVDIGGAFETILQAFPNITGGPVSAIDVDARGRVWFATDRGLVRTDGRDWFQFQAGAGDGDGGSWVHLGRVDRPFEPRAAGWGAWRFDRASATWEHADLTLQTWGPVTVIPETTAEAGVRAVLWTDCVVADLLQDWDGSTFSSSAPADLADVRVRYKPTDRRIVDGGIPSSPRLPPGASTWRYLSMEPAKPKLPKERPFWSTEGRLIPPPGDHDASVPGRFDEQAPDPVDFGDAVFAYDPAARVWMTWEAARPLTVLVRVATRSADERLEPAVIDRAWQGIQQVRPAGVFTVLAVDEDIVRR